MITGTLLESARYAHQQGHWTEVIAAARQYLAWAPDDVEVHWLLGTALLQLDQPVDAVAHLERSAAKSRRNAAVLGALAQAYLAAGRPEDAQQTFRKASQADLRNWRYRMGAANAAAVAGKLTEAEVALRQLTEKHPRESLIWFNYGNVLRDQDRHLEALECFERAVALAPDFIDARNNQGAALLSLERHADAESVFRACLTLSPGDPRTLCNLASVLIDVGRFAEAESLCRDVLAREPSHVVALRFLGSAIGQQGRLVESLAPLRRALQLAPEDVVLAAAYGATLCDCGQHAAGMRQLAAAQLQAPDTPAVMQSIATASLTRGALAEGWDAYQARPARAVLQGKYPAIVFARTVPEDCAGATICIQREQGLGDELFFLRYAAMLRERGARIVVRASAKLAGVLARAHDIDHVVVESEEWPTADYYLLAGDLPHAIGGRPASVIPADRSPSYRALGPDYPESLTVCWPAVPPPLHLAPRPDRVAAIREELARAGEGPYIGLTWRAGTAPEDQRGASWNLHKNVPLAALGAALVTVPGTLVALQRKPAPRDLETLSATVGRPVHDCTALNDDLESMLALLSVLDEYLAVSNTNVHLRAGTGRMSRVFVPQPAEWRWRASGHQSPWFPGSPIYRQATDGRWDDALLSLATDLRTY